MKKNQFYYLFILFCFSYFFISCEKDNESYRIPENGLVCYYEFLGSAKDLSGNGNNGNIRGATLTMDRFNITNEAFSFNGVDSYIDKDNPSFRNDSIGTFITWIKLNKINHIEYVGSISDTNTVDYYISLLRIEPSDSTVGIYYREPIKADWIQGETKLTTGIYYQLALRADGEKWDIYVNGEKDNLTIKVGTNSGKWFNDLSNLDKFVIGNLIIKEPYAKPPFDGVIDQILLYNRALNDSEIKDIYINTRK